MKKFFLSSIAVLISLSLFFTIATAQTKRLYRGPVISPVNAILDANRGDILSGSIRFTNDLEQDQDLNMIVTKQDFKLTQDYVIDETPKYPPNASLASWITLEKTKITAKRGESVDLHYTIKIPITAEYGGHYATIAFATDPDIKQQIAIQARLQFPILLNINGNRVEKLDIQSFKTDSDLYENTNVNFTTLVQNLGNVHLNPHGKIDIKGGLIGGGTELEFNPDYKSNSGYVLPDKEIARKYENTWNDNTFRIGQYTATLTMYYDTLSGETSITSSVQFWIIPWKLILGIIGSIIFIIILLIITKKIRRKLKKKGKSKNIELD